MIRTFSDEKLYQAIEEKMLEDNLDSKQLSKLIAVNESVLSELKLGNRIDYYDLINVLDWLGRKFEDFVIEVYPSSTVVEFWLDEETETFTLKELEFEHDVVTEDQIYDKCREWVLEHTGSGYGWSIVSNEED